MSDKHYALGRLDSAERQLDKIAVGLDTAEGHLDGGEFARAAGYAVSGLEQDKRQAERVADILDEVREILESEAIAGGEDYE